MRAIYPAFVLTCLLAACSGGGGNTPSGNNPTSTPTGAVPSATPTSKAGGSATPAPSPAPTATARATFSPTPSAAPTATPTGGSAGVPTIGTCQVFPADNLWNTDISNTTAYPADPNSSSYMAEMNPSNNINLHPDFGSDPSYGIPINIVTIPSPGPGFVPIDFTGYPSESDPGPYPIPSSPAIEAGSDHHMLIVDQSNCTLYETWEQAGSASAGWSASNGAVFNLNSDAYRPDGWTSADAAGLPIAPGLVRYAEVQAGAINHAVRFTISTSYAGQILPARHHAGGTTPFSPPMGTRLRLKASYNISGFTGNAHVILVALQKYGMILADNGSSFYITGETNPNWNDTDLNQLKSVPASAFEVLKIGTIDTTARSRTP